MATITFNRESFLQSIRQHKQKKREWQARMVREEAELQVEVERAKQDPFYQRGSDGMVGEPSPIPQPIFKSGSLVNAIRAHRNYQQEWQERINRELDELEETRHAAREKFQKEMELIEV